MSLTKNPRTKKTNIQSSIIAALVLLLLVCAFSYASAPTSDSFLEAINPVDAFIGLAFTFSYFGLPFLLSYSAAFLFFVLLWFPIKKLVSWLLLRI